MFGAQIAHKLRIGVFMGGRSIEREVSFNSGRTICDHLDTDAYEIMPIFQTAEGILYVLPWHFLHRGKISDFYHRLQKEAQCITWDELKAMVDFVYVAVHGRYAEDGTLQGMLDVLGIPYLGTKVLGSALGMNKSKQKDLFKAHGIEVPRGITLSAYEIESLTAEDIVERLSGVGVHLPVIVKPFHEGSSLGISCVKNIEDIHAAVVAASSADAHHKQDVIVEEKIDGMEFVCVLLQKVSKHNELVTKEWMALPLTQVIPETTSDIFDYEQKYMPGRATKITPAPFSCEQAEAIIKTCMQASDLLGFTTISRIDGFVARDGRIVLIDPNTLTGMSPATFLFHQAAEIGMSHTTLINFLIENELVHYGLSAMASHQREKEGFMVAAAEEKKRVIVLLGGDSNEREISLESGRNVCYKLSPKKYEVIPVFVHETMELYRLSQRHLIKNSTREIAAQLDDSMRISWSELPQLADFVFLGLHGGKGEGGSVQGALEMLKLPYNGSGVLASALCMDKFKTTSYLRHQGFDVPDSFLLARKEWEAYDAQRRAHFCNNLPGISYPVIIKPHDDGCSVMVGKANNAQELEEKIAAMFATNKQHALIEECIVGTELTCGVVGNDDVTALVPSQVVANKGILSLEEKFLPGAGENQTPALIPSDAIVLVQKTMAAAFKAIGCKGYARIDCFYQSAAQSKTGAPRVVIIEFNTLPALTPATCLFHQAAELGVKPMEFIDTIVNLGFKVHGGVLDKISDVKCATELLMKKKGVGEDVLW